MKTVKLLLALRFWIDPLGTTNQGEEMSPGFVSLRTVVLKVQVIDLSDDENCFRFLDFFGF